MLPADTVAFEGKVDQPEQMQADEKDRQTPSRRVP
jgi:hypothetical protein